MDRLVTHEKPMRGKTSGPEWCSVACAVCGSGESLPIKHFIQNGNGVSVAICRRCGLVFLNPRWTEARYQLYYKAEYDSTFRPLMRQLSPALEPTALEVYSRLPEEVFFSATSVLDIGAGEGNVLRFLTSKMKNECRAYAIEPSHEGRQLLEKSHVQVLSHDIHSDWQVAQQGKMDLIVMRHVLEHFMDPLAALKKIASALSARGRLYLAVPDMMSPVGSPAYYWFRAAHTYYFSRDTLKSLMAQAGLQPEGLFSSNSEIWGLFRKSPGGPVWSIPDCYEEQIACLSQYLQAWRWRDYLMKVHLVIRQACPSWVKCFVPRPWRTWLRNRMARKARI